MHYGSLRQIEAYRCLMVTGSMTLAARMMGVTQPAISRLIKDLQAELRMNLFEKRGTGVIPTAEAMLLYMEVERSFVGLERIRASAEEIRTRRAGSLKIATMSALANGVLSRFAGEFLASRPQLDMELFGMTSPLVIDLVANQQCDIGFAYFPIANPGLGKVSMPTQSEVAVLPARHRLAGNAVVTPRDFEGETFISLKHGAVNRRRTDQIFADHGVSRNIRVEALTSTIMCGLISSGFGVGICDRFTASEFASRGVVARPFRPKIPFKFAAFFSPSAPPSPIAHEFLNEFRAHLLASTEPH